MDVVTSVRKLNKWHGSGQNINADGFKMGSLKPVNLHLL